jgi:hypothetical protein
MPLTKTLRASLQDFATLRQTVAAGIEMNTSLLGLAERWFQNVEVVYPIAEMPITQEQRATLGETVLQEMVSAVTSAIDAIEAETDPDEIMPELATTLDGLWRELTGVYATVLNVRFAENTEGIDPEEILDQIREGLRQQAEMNDMDEHEIRQEMLSNEHIRAGLRHLGINPDAL